ncbi:MAG: hypothetical protein L6420_02415 [Elusimicrobia bacterium]|nr:hypothetical protein [Elusimicrobiota bacterium]
MSINNDNGVSHHLYAIWPVHMPNDYLNWLNQAQIEDEEKGIRKSILKGIPYGNGVWVGNVVKSFGLEQTLRKVGRPKIKNGG